MPSDGSRIEVWCEDREHEQFVRALLTERFGVQRRSLSFNIAPRGRGSAAQWVIRQYPSAADKARATRHQTRLGFLVVVDGDRFGVAARKRELCGDPDARQNWERIAIWVPTWSIETWILWLCGRDVREKRDCKAEMEAHYAALVAQAVGAWDPARTGEGTAAPSLSAARAELKRLPLD